MEKLKAYLNETGLSQAQLAKGVGVSPGHISAILSKLRSPSLDTAVAIERATNGAVPASAWVDAPSPSGASQ